MAIRFLATNLWDTATLTANSAATGFPASNTATRLFLEHWRSTGIAAEWLKADLGADTVVRAIAIRYSSLQVGDSLKIQAQTAANGDDWDGTPPLTLDVTITITAAMVSKGLFIYNWETAPTACRYFRILMTQTAGSYIYVGRVYLGTFVEPARNYARGWGKEPVDPSTVLESTTGQKYTNQLPQYRRLKISFPAFGSADKALFEALSDVVGSTRTFFVELDSASNLQAESYYVTCPSGWPIYQNGLNWSMSLTMDEERGGA